MLEICYTIIIYPITQIIEFVFVFAQKAFKVTGISVSAVSIAISVMTLPLYAVAEKWQRLERDTQRRLKPKVAKIRAVFRGDERHMILATYYRQNHYHPLYALRGAVGLCIQVPFFIAAYSYLSHLEVLNGSRFLFITDLGLPDSIIRLGGISIHLLPVLMTLVNGISGTVYAAGLSIKEKIQLYGMALLFLALLYNAPSGLVLYWLLNNIFSLLKNIYYKIDYRHKKTAVVGLVSLLCISGAGYLLLLSRGNIRLRMAFSAAALLAALLPWVPRSLARFSGGNAGTFRRIRSAVKRLRTLPGYTEKDIARCFTGCVAILWLLTGAVVPSALIASSPEEFAFIDNNTTPLVYIAHTALQSFGFFVFWPLAFFFLLREKTKKALAICAAALSAVFLCDIFVFKGNYGTISLNLTFTGQLYHSLFETAFNTALLACSVFALIALFYKCKKYFFVCICACLFALAGVSVFNIVHIQRAFIALTQYRHQDDLSLVQAEPVFHLSQTGKNIIIIMLDRAISAYAPFIFDENPELKNAYSGFVYYPNTVSLGGHTSIGATPIFGGYEAGPERINKRQDATLKQKHTEALLMLPTIFSGLGYSVTVTDPPYANYQAVSDLRIYGGVPNTTALITDSAYTDIWIRDHFSLPSTGEILQRNLFWYGIFRASPYMFRDGIYMSGDWCSPVAHNDLRLTINGYAVLHYLPRLTDFSAGTENTAMLFVNNTTHETILMQAPDYVPVKSVTNFGDGPYRKEPAYHVNAGALKRLADWFLFLKANNAYDNSRIIIVADHGPEDMQITGVRLPFYLDKFNPLLMVKDFNAGGDLRTDTAFMSNADVPAIALRDLIEEPVNPFTGNAIDQNDKRRPLYIAVSGSSGLDDPDEARLSLNPKMDFWVHDNVFNPANWEQVEP
jgi:YidC/Oxa1 family membrane protein insertase